MTISGHDTAIVHLKSRARSHSQGEYDRWSHLHDESDCILNYHDEEEPEVFTLCLDRVQQGLNKRAWFVIKNLNLTVYWQCIGLPILNACLPGSPCRWIPDAPRWFWHLFPIAPAEGSQRRLKVAIVSKHPKPIYGPSTWRSGLEQCLDLLESFLTLMDSPTRAL